MKEDLLFYEVMDLIGFDNAVKFFKKYGKTFVQFTGFRYLKNSNREIEIYDMFKDVMKNHIWPEVRAMKYISRVNNIDYNSVLNVITRAKKYEKDGLDIREIGKIIEKMVKV